MTDPADGRGKVVELTGEGVDLIRAIESQWTEALEPAAALLSAEEQGILTSLLGRMAGYYSARGNGS